MNELIGISTATNISHIEIMEKAWNDVKQYRYAYNQQIMMNSGLLHKIQIGLSKSNKLEYKINRNYSILTHWALLRHKNKTNSVYKITNKQCIEEYINLKKQQRKFKIGKGGAYSTDCVFKQLDIISTNNIYPHQLKSIGEGIYNMIPKQLHTFLPPLMSGNTVRQYQTVQMMWYYDQINKVIFHNRKNPVVNAALDAATFKGHWGAKVIPMELTTYNKILKCGFRWTESHQPINPTKETGNDLCKKLKEFTEKFPAINELNAVANDDGPTSSTHIELQRKTNPLLIEILDTAHLFNTVVQVPIKEVWGQIKLEYNRKTVKKAYVPTAIKLTSKDVERHAGNLSFVVRHYHPNEFRRNKASSDTRFSGNIDASETLITKKLVKLYDSDDEIYDDDSDEDYDQTHSIESTDIDILKSTEPLQLVQLLPELSDNERNTLSLTKVKSKFRSPHKNRVNIDKKLYNKHQHLESFRKRNLTFDLKRFVLILETVVTNP
eukprot:188976_1